MSTGPQSNLSAPAGSSASDEVFNDNFSGTTQYWHPYITSNNAKGALWAAGGSGGSSEANPDFRRRLRPSQPRLSRPSLCTDLKQLI